MGNALDVIGAIQNIFLGMEVGLGWWIVYRIMNRIFG